jgi:tagatose-1,6-bisphosphate aldolase
MPTEITSGKRKGLEAVADSREVIAALAIDQRGAMRRLFGKAIGDGVCQCAS